MAANLLHIYLLGDFRLVLGDELITAVNSPRMQSLLAYLLLHRGAPQPRYHIAFLLWPDSPEGQARSNLRNLIHRLQHALPELEAFISNDNRDLCWQANAPFTFDLADFENALAQAQQAETAGDQAALQAALEQAVEAYAGDLLPSCYDEWIMQHRERLRQAVSSALEHLSILQENQFQYRQAINSAQRLLRYDPLDEAIYRRLMRLHARSGDRAGALRVYNTCVTVLKRELDVDPDASTRAIYDSLLSADTQPAVLPAAGSGTSANEARAKNKHNLPDPLTSFVGREREVAAVKRMLSTTRLLTLTGAFGAGKTRLAREVAFQLVEGGAFADGVWWIDLASITDPTLAPQAVASVLGVREKPGEDLPNTLSETLRDRSILLLFDNCEHLIPACTGLAASLLRSCPKLRILATSREALSIKGEIAWPVPPLAFPTEGAREEQDVSRNGSKQEPPDLLPATHPMERAPRSEETAGAAQYESVILFVERAAAVLPTFQLTARNNAAVAQICRRLEGIPLAIELAAARVKMLSVEQIAARLDNALHLLKANWGDELPHHQTLQAAIDWSYDLLSEPEKLLLRRFSVFTGGFTLEAAEQIAAFQVETNGKPPPAGLTPADVLDLLSRLIDKSLVSVVEQEQGGEVRYRLLEVVRQYTRERLVEASELEAAMSCHASFFLNIVEEALPKLRSAEQERWINRLDCEHDNLCAALAWAVSAEEDAGKGPRGAETGLRLAAGMWQYWDVRGYFTEGRRCLQEALAKAPDRTIARAKALNAAGALAWGQGDYASAKVFLSESLPIQQEFGNQRDIAAGFLNLGILNVSQGDYPSARPLLDESLRIFRELDHRAGISNVLNSLGIWASDQADYASARVYFEESLVLRREFGDKRGIAIVLGNLGVAAWRQGDFQAARPLLQESLERYKEIGDRRGAATSLNELARLAERMGEYDLAHQLLMESLVIWQELKNFEGIASFMEVSAGLANAWHDYERAARLLAAAETLRQRIGAPLPPADRLDYSRIHESVQVSLSGDRLAALWTEGRTLSIEAATEQAIRSQPLPGYANP